MSGADMETLKVRDVMLSLDEYAVVHVDATMMDAIQALEGNVALVDGVQVLAHRDEGFGSAEVELGAFVGVYVGGFE